jgi:hypothetical protein
MYDELVKRLREDAPTALVNCDFDFVEGWIKEAADAIENLSNAGSAYGRGWTLGYDTGREESKPRWIPVTEEPPLKVGDDGYNGYLVYANGYYEVADYTTDKLDNVPYFHVNGEYEPDVTHYMPLPEPPKEE